jgi:hypothetical protein
MGGCMGLYAGLLIAAIKNFIGVYGVVWNA